MPVHVFVRVPVHARARACIRARCMHVVCVHQGRHTVWECRDTKDYRYSFLDTVEVRSGAYSEAARTYTLKKAFFQQHSTESRRDAINGAPCLRRRRFPLDTIGTRRPRSHLPDPRPAQHVHHRATLSPAPSSISRCHIPLSLANLVMERSSHDRSQVISGRMKCPPVSALQTMSLAE